MLGSFLNLVCELFFVANPKQSLREEFPFVALWYVCADFWFVEYFFLNVNFNFNFIL